MARILRPNQENAIQISKENDFCSGIHYHATGAGKSWIAIYILFEYYNKYPNNNVVWVCEKKDILRQQFNKDTIKERGFRHILNKYNVLNFVDNKFKEWYVSLNSAKYWNKPYLCIINRTYLTNRKKYRKIQNKIDLVLHDECHSIENKSTQQFYKWLYQKNPSVKVIGFSATPELLFPLKQILSKYSIYDAFKDNIILPPKIIWIKSKYNINQNDLLKLLDLQISKLPYKKIIVWCGIIEEAINTANIWSQYFKDYKICLDFNNNKNNNNKFGNFNEFYNLEEKGILFCAVKHREGSDIPNIDGCIFMDLVSERSERVFIQCMGRVLRKDKLSKKKYGLVIDLKAKSTIEVCNRVQYYLKLNNTFPWKYDIKNYKGEKQVYFINELDMIIPYTTIISHKIKDNKYTKEQIKDKFIRKIPNGNKYIERLEYELNLIIEKNLFGNMVRAIEILDLTKNIPHVTRGSCGSSLVCYLLGISHMDPVKYNIKFSRFINRYRDTLPDIDFDFPHYLRDEVFLKLFQKWGNKVARISNHIYYHEKSALRESLRIHGINKFISKFEINNEINKLEPRLKSKILKTQKELDGTFRGYSLHCGGIVYYPDGIPKDNILDKKNTSILKQVCFNKVDISKNKNFKIDILSSRALSQLYHCVNFHHIDFDSNITDKRTIDLLCKGDNIGIILGESPLMRKALILIQPKTIMDLAICLSIIRPAAKSAKKEFEIGKFKNNSIIFDDDVILAIAKYINNDEELADKIRRDYSKGNIDSLESHIKIKNKLGPLKKKLNNLRKYGFCKAHALSYAQLLWQLAYQKTHNPKRFWESTLKNVKSSYRKWVHLYEAHCSGININQDNDNKSIYALARNKTNKINIDNLEHLKKYGYWKFEKESKNFFPDCYFYTKNNIIYFKGLIASSRTLYLNKNKKLVLFIGIDYKEYKEIIVDNPRYFDSRYVIIEGTGTLKNNLYKSIESLGDEIKFI